MVELLLVRHAAAQVSDHEPPRAWPLTNGGAADATRLGNQIRERFPRRSLAPVASSERKAIETATCVLGEPPTVDQRFDEVGRPWYDDPAEMRSDAIRYLHGQPVLGWETQAEATARFSAAVADAVVAVAGRLPVLVTHGTVLSLWLASAVENFEAASFWVDLEFPDAYLVTFRDATVGTKATASKL